MPDPEVNPKFYTDLFGPDFKIADFPKDFDPVNFNPLKFEPKDYPQYFNDYVYSVLDGEEKLITFDGDDF